MTPIENPFSTSSSIPPRAFLAGLLIGGAAALLIPAVGRFRLRGKRRVANSLREVKNSLKDVARGVAEMANDRATRVSDSAKPYVDAASKTADAASGLYDSGMRRARREADRLADAVHAAAEAYSHG